MPDNDTFSGLAEFCRALRNGDPQELELFRDQFVSRNWNLVTAIDQIAGAELDSGDFHEAMKKFEVLEQLSPRNNHFFLRRISSAIRANIDVSRNIKQLAEASQRIRADNELLVAVDELIANDRIDLALRLIDDCAAKEGLSPRILAVCRSRVIAATGNLTEALNFLTASAGSAPSLAYARLHYVLLRRLLKFKEAQAVLVQAALDFGESHEFRLAVEQYLFIFDVGAAANLISSFRQKYPSKLEVVEEIAGQVAREAGTLEAALAEHGVLSTKSAEIFEILSKPGIQPSRIVWGKASLAHYLRDGLDEDDYVKFAWFLPNWEHALVRQHALSAAMRTDPSAPSVARGWLHHLISDSAFGDAAKHCQQMFTDLVDEDTLFFAILLLRLEHDRIAHTFMDTKLFELLYATAFLNAPNTHNQASDA